jgi:hypothetical protein
MEPAASAAVSCPPRNHSGSTRMTILGTPIIGLFAGHR